MIQPLALAETNSPERKIPLIDETRAFFFGMLGALCMYGYTFRKTRLLPAMESLRQAPSEKRIVPTERGWIVREREVPLIICDLLLGMLLAGVAAAYMVPAVTVKEAILTGCTWNAVFGGVAKKSGKRRTKRDG